MLRSMIARGIVNIIKFNSMEEEKILKKLQEQDEKLDVIYKSVEQIRKIFWAMIIISVVTFVLPAIGLIFVIPWFLSVMGEVYSGLL